MTRLGYRFDSDTEPTWVASDMPLEPHARRFWRGWPFAADARALGRADILVEALPGELAERYTDPKDNWGGGYRLHHASIDGGSMDCPSDEEAANQLAGVLVAHRVRTTAGAVAVHAAACETPAGVIVLPGPSMSGKSTLSLQLMLLGGRLFADDRLLLHPAAGTAETLGLTPRLRLPVPVDAGRALAALARDHGLPDGTIAYLDLDDSQAPPFGTRAKISAFVAPERLADGPPRLEAASAGTIVRALLGGAVTGSRASATTLAAIAGLAGRLPCFSLRWSSSAQAAELLWRRLGTPLTTP